MLDIKIDGERNPTIVIKDDTGLHEKKLLVIGDPHLGRVFKTGVPKTKLGMREELVYIDFNNKLNVDSSYSGVYVVGDLFDKTIVSNECLLRSIDIISSAAKANPDIEYWIIAGNHDLVKDTSKKSTFDVFKTHMDSLSIDNLHIIGNEEMLKGEYYSYTDVGSEKLTLMAIAYDPFTSLNITNIEKAFTPNTIVFGHWEIEDFSAMSGTSKFIERSIPEVILQNASLIVTGHEHKPKTVYIDKGKKLKVKCVVSGSMQPYAHGEQLSHEVLYKTVSVNDLLVKLGKNKDVFKNTNLRILMSVDDIMPEQFECLSRTYQMIDEKIVAEAEEAKEDLNKIEVLSFHGLFLKSLKKLQEDETLDKTMLKNIEASFVNKNYLKDNF